MPPVDYRQSAKATSEVIHESLTKRGFGFVLVLVPLDAPVGSKANVMVTANIGGPDLAALLEEALEQAKRRGFTT